MPASHRARQSRINMYTVAGNPVSCTAGLATLDDIQAHGMMDWWRTARAIGAYLLEGFQSLGRTHPLIGEGRGKGIKEMLVNLGVELVRDRAGREPAALEAAKRVYRCKERGLILFDGGICSNVIEVTPPLTPPREQADQGLAIVDQALSDVEAGRFPAEKLGLYAGW